MDANASGRTFKFHRGQSLNYDTVGTWVSSNKTLLAQAFICSRILLFGIEPSCGAKIPMFSSNGRRLNLCG